ncbi:MAG: hypothetical protein M1608_15840 [Candidatus Omnitrophica bacterium]|nr:hypothetical protein [Candidatus Omnitrophota bacterium]
MRWREFIRHNFWLKLFALVLATLTWITVRFAIQHEIGLVQNPLANAMTREFKPLPIRVLTEATDLRNFKITPPEASITVSGEAGLIGSLSKQDIQVFVDMADAGDEHEWIKKVNAVSPMGVSIIRISPIWVRVERILPAQQSSLSNKP